MSIAELQRTRLRALKPTRDELIDALQSRLRACVCVLEVLIETGRVDSSCHETIERVVRQANQKLPRE